MRKRKDIKRLLWQLAGRNNWDVIEEIDFLTWQIEKMPPKMRLIIGYKIQGYPNKDIAELTKSTMNMIRVTVSQAKRRILVTLL